MRVLVTGGAGYIGSHAVLELLAAGHEAVSLDDYSNSSPESLRRVARLAGRAAEAVEGDVRDRALLGRLFAERRFDAVVHFAGLKAVGESVAQPLRYFDVNVGGAVSLLSAMQGAGCRRLVFSSSATVYGAPRENPITEDFPLSAVNPYGRTKLVIEDMCRDLAASGEAWHIALLRYFNPVGAHESGDIGEDPRGVPNNLMPYVMQTAVGRRPHVNVLGDDYPTPDGTGVRDYIHVVDLAKAHVAALERVESFEGAEPVNLGTGRGHSVLEVLAAASAAVGREVPRRVAPRRPGDAAAVWADPSRARERLGWKAQRSLADMCRDHWRWQQKNPEGYGAR
ncbi:MAG: UDP-glucose 4-epimerase GalE [Elusimicrobia bacterium]|nr:UDP-glucose 4-epimerase GalE [Elusimicrobiota bacterium]